WSGSIGMYSNPSPVMQLAMCSSIRWLYSMMTSRRSASVSSRYGTICRIGDPATVVVVVEASPPVEAGAVTSGAPVAAGWVVVALVPVLVVVGASALGDAQAATAMTSTVAIRRNGGAACWLMVLLS